MGGAFGLVDYAGQLRVFNIACQRLSKVKFFVLDARNKLIIRSYLEFAMIGRTCSRFHRGHVFIVEYGLLLCIHIYIYIFLGVTCFTCRLVVKTGLFCYTFPCCFSDLLAQALRAKDNCCEWGLI